MSPLLFCASLLPMLALAASPDPRASYDAIAADTQKSNTERLHALFDLEWNRSLQEYPEFATFLGIPGEDDRWTDLSPEAIQRRKEESLWPLAVLQSIDREKLSPADQLNYDLFLRNAREGQEWRHFPGELLAINQLGGIQQDAAQTIETMPASSVKACEAILARLRALPRLIEQNRALLERGVAQGITPPRVVLRDVPGQIQNMIPPDPLASPLLRPFTQLPGDIPAPEQERLRAAACTIYRKQIVPTFETLLGYLVETYIPAARETIGWSALPDGPAWYALSVRSQTTTDKTPREIHALGLREVSRIRGEMDKIISETGFKGSFEEFTQFLRANPQFYFKKPEDLLAGYRDIAKHIDPELPRLFGKLPRLPYGVKAIPDYAAESQPTAYYHPGSLEAGRPGWFQANTSHLDTRPKWEMECLTAHEAVPGHHLQISLAQEMDNVPEFRKHDGYTAFTEGWGLYAESLGGELGLYKDPYSKFGSLTYEMWRAARLVVDTGIHALGWSRQQAIDYLVSNTGKSTHDATVEIDRYIVWPGQALAYKIGQLKIQELRDHAKKELRETFDIRAFHDTLLANGALPLTQLETIMNAWTASQKASGPHLPNTETD